MNADKRPESEPDEKKFNETLKRMLKTPPKPHEKPAKDRPEPQPAKKPPQDT